MFFNHCLDDEQGRKSEMLVTILFEKGNRWIFGSYLVTSVCYISGGDDDVMLSYEISFVLFDASVLSN